MCIINVSCSSVAQQPSGGSAAALEHLKMPKDSIDCEPGSNVHGLSSVPSALQRFQSPRWTGTRRIVRATRGGRRSAAPSFRIIPREWLMHLRDVKRVREDSGNEGPVGKKQRSVAEADQRQWMQPFSQRQEEAYEDFQKSHMLQGNVRVSSVGTHQGKADNPHSTNACAVIATTAASYHLSEPENDGIGGETVKHIIDDLSGTLAQDIRRANNVEEMGLLEQHQVNEYLTEELAMFDQDPAKAPEPVGGNVLAPGDLLRLSFQLDGGLERPKEKAAATFYFRHHVISILRCLDKETGEHWFEIIDSLPCHNGSAFHCQLRNIAAVESFLLSYCSLKLPSEFDAGSPFNAMDTSDPRMFQAFIWTE